MLRNYFDLNKINFLKIVITLFILIVYIFLNSSGSESVEGSGAIGAAFLALLMLIPTTLLTLLFLIKYFNNKSYLKLDLTSLGLMIFLSQLYFIYGKLFIVISSEIFNNYITPILITFISIIFIYRPMIKEKQLNSIGLMAAFIISCIQPNEFYLLFMNILMFGTILYLLSKDKRLNFPTLILVFPMCIALVIATFPLLYILFATASQSEQYQQGIYEFRLSIHVIWFCIVITLILLSFIKNLRLLILLVSCIYLVIFDLYKNELLTQFIYVNSYANNIIFYNFHVKNIKQDLLNNNLGFCSYILINAYKTSIFLIILAAINQYIRLNKSTIK